MTIDARQPRPRRRRTLAPAVALVAIYLLSGLVGNLHLVLVDHHDAIGHGHEHHASPCPVTEWTPVDGCDHHDMLADHDVVEAGMVRTVKVASQAAVLPVAASWVDDETDAALDADPASLAPREGVYAATPIRAPPADLLSV